MKKTFIFLLFLFNVTINTYASYIVHYKETGAVEVDEIVKVNSFNDKTMEITNSEVTFNEDDKDYIFYIKQDMECKNLKCNYTYSFVVPDIILAPFKNINKLVIYSSNRSMYNSVITMDTINEYARLNGSEIAVFYDSTTYNNNTDKWEHSANKRCTTTFYMTDPHAFYLVTKKDMDTTPHNVSCTRSHNYSTKQIKEGEDIYRYGEYYMHVDHVVRIKKEEINNYRYMANYVTMAFSANNDKDDHNVKKTYYNLCSTPIDLLEAVEGHIHNFKIRDIYKDYHELYCEGCKWLKKNNHNYVDSYDGIENNLCECGKHKYINLHIENNIDDDVFDGVVEAYDTFPIYNLDKTGHTIKYIKCEEKVLGNVEEYIINDNLVLPSYIPNNSTKYYIYYDVNMYRIRFNKENNLNLDLSSIENMDDMIFAYGETKTLDRCKYLLEGYEFLGWTLYEYNINDDDVDPISKIDFRDEFEIKNLTTEDDMVFNLYPLYRVINFEVTYKSNVNNQILLIKKYNLFSNEDFPSYKGFNINGGKYRFGSWIVNGESIKPYNTKSLLKYVKKDNDKIDVIARFYEYKDGYQYGDDKGEGPIGRGDKDGNGSGGGGGGSPNNETTYETTNETMESKNNLNDGNSFVEDENENVNESIVDKEDGNDKETIEDIEKNDKKEKEDSNKEENDDEDDYEDDVSDNENDDESPEDEGEKGLVDFDNNEDGSGDANTNNKNESLMYKIRIFLENAIFKLIKFFKELYNAVFKNIMSFINHIKEMVLHMGLNQTMLLTFLIGGVITFYYFLLFIIFIVKKIRAEFTKNNIKN